MRAEGTTASIPSDVRDVIEFFDNELGEVQFPDIDRTRLAELARMVAQRSEELERKQEEMRAARDALDRAQAELRHAAERGLAYARVYVDGDKELSAALAELTLNQGAEERKPRGRARGRTKTGKAGPVKSEDSAGTKPTLPFTGTTITEAA